MGNSVAPSLKERRWEVKMNNGFTYRGIHSSKFNVEYIPDPQARWFHSPEYDVYKEDVAGRDGGYYYGNNLKIRTFE